MVAFLVVVRTILVKYVVRSDSTWFETRRYDHRPFDPTQAVVLLVHFVTPSHVCTVKLVCTLRWRSFNTTKMRPLGKKCVFKRSAYV